MTTVQSEFWTNSKSVSDKNSELWRGGHIIFAFSGVRRHTWFLVISRKSIYPIFTRFGMGVCWVNSLHGNAFGEDSSIAS